MAASVPTVDAVMLKSFGRPKIMEALELFGVRANARTGAKALKEQLLQLIQDQAPCRMVGDGMVMNGAPAHAPAAAAGTAPGAKPSTASEVSAHACRLGQTPSLVSCMRVWLSSLTLASYNLQSTCTRRRPCATSL